MQREIFRFCLTDFAKSGEMISKNKKIEVPYSKKKMKRKESKFMNDQSESDHGLESILDYELSWALRMAADKECQENKPRLYHQCRHILFTLMGLSDSPEINIEVVEVWKQWNYIDLVADVYLSINGKKELHVILVENKAYTKMTEHQRDVYPEVIQDEYKTNPRYKDYRDYRLHQVLVTCFSTDNDKYLQRAAFIKGTDWSIKSVEELPDWTAKEQTESDLFNEFWLNKW